MSDNTKINVYELDFGDQNLLSTDIKGILSWIEADMDNMKFADEKPVHKNGKGEPIEDDDDELQYTITIKRMTQEEVDALPEWGN